MPVYCPVCHAENDSGRTECRRCRSPVAIDGRFVLDEPPPRAGGEDVVDATRPLASGHDLESGRAVEIRLADGEGRTRLEREATVLRGLGGFPVPEVLAQASIGALVSALVLEPPPFPTLEDQLARGLRIDDARARDLLDAILSGLARMHGLSPPVCHRNLSPEAIAWDGGRRVVFRDFARATDTVRDAVEDLVLARPGYGPSRPTTPQKADLYGAAATLVHVLGRVPPGDLPRRPDGTPDIRPAIVVSDRLERLLERLMRPGAQDAFPDAEAALAALREREPEPAIPVPGRDRNRKTASGIAVVAVALGLLGATAGLGAFLSIRSSGSPSADDAAERAAGRLGARASGEPERPARAASGPGARASGEPERPARAASGPGARASVEPERPARAASGPGARASGEPERAARAASGPGARASGEPERAARAASGPGARASGEPERPAREASGRGPRLAASPRPRRPSPATGFEQAILRSKDQLEGCADPAVDRLRFVVTLTPAGGVDQVESVGRTRGASAPCAKEVLESLSVSAPGAKTKVEVWLWLHPKLVVNTY